jgi:Tfp pilus assembly protein PilF
MKTPAAKPVARFPSWLPAMMLLVGTALLYAPARDYDFVNYDDHIYVTQNRQVRSGLTWKGLEWDLISIYGANWHPLTWLSLQIDAKLHGLQAGGYHLTNVALHALNAWLLYRFLFEVTGALWRSWCVAALFSWHPLHIESVAWVAERKDVLSGAFAFLTLLAYARYVKRGWSFAWVVLFFSLGLLAKPMLVTLPFVLLLLDYWPLERYRLEPFGRLVREKLPLFGLALASCAITLIAQERGGAVRSLAVAPFGERLTNAIVAYVVYLRKTIWPVDLAVFYPYQSIGFTDWRLIAAVLLLAAISLLASWTAKSRPYLLVGWLWYLGMLVPVIGLVTVGAQALADRYTYLPLTGIFIAAVWGVDDILSRAPRIVPATIAVLVLSACLFTSDRQLGYWRNGMVLWEHAEAVTPRSAITERGLGTAFVQDRDFRPAAEHLRAALELDPDDEIAHLNLANVYAELDETALAERHYEKALALNSANPETHYNFGLVLGRSGRHVEAARHVRRAIELNPDNWQYHQLLAEEYRRLGQPVEAEREQREAIRLDRDR